jgi:hypothetical protein
MAVQGDVGQGLKTAVVEVEVFRADLDLFTHDSRFASYP